MTAEPGTGVAPGVAVGVGDGVPLGVTVGVGLGEPLVASYPIASMTRRSTALKSFLTPELPKALKASLVPLAQSCGSPPFAFALLKALSSAVPLLIEKDLPGPVFKPRALAPV